MVIKYSSKLLLLPVALLFFMSQISYAELYNTKHNKKQVDPIPVDNISSNKNTFPSTPAQEEAKPSPKTSPKISEVTLTHMKNVASFCIDSWESKICLKELSSVSMSMATRYAEALDSGGQKSSMESLKQHCAASTAALKISVPAYAMKSAITECVNTISDINTATSITPNINLYQILVSSVICLSKDVSCKDIELQLSPFK